MIESELEVSADDIPEPPSGYSRYQPDFRISRRWNLILLTYFGIIVASAAKILLMLYHLRSNEVERVVVITFAGVVFLYVLHEMSHYLVGKAIGGRVTLDFFQVPDEGKIPRLRPVVHTFDTYRTRWENVLLYAAPLLIITSTCLMVAVFSSESVVGLAALVVLVINMMGSALDFRNVVETFCLPSNALEFHFSRDRDYYFIPESNEGVSESRS